MKRHLEIRAADILMPDRQRMGGVTEFMKAAALCDAFHTPISSHLFMEASSHLLAAAPNGLILEDMDWWQGLFAGGRQLQEGQGPLPNQPGDGPRGPGPRGSGGAGGSERGELRRRGRGGRCGATGSQPR